MLTATEPLYVVARSQEKADAIKHLREMLIPLATTVFQGITAVDPKQFSERNSERSVARRSIAAMPMAAVARS